jgi:hypothetical protein
MHPGAHPLWLGSMCDMEFTDSSIGRNGTGPGSSWLRLVPMSWLMLAGAIVAMTGSGCRGERATPEFRDAGGAAEPERVGRYALAERALYRLNDGQAEAVAVLPGGGAATDTLDECAVDFEGVVEVRFKRLTLSPDSQWAAWETSGPGACVGVLGPPRSPVEVLGHWSAARSDSVLWAPAGRYLAVWLVRPKGRRSLWVFDGIDGRRLEMPWDEDCAYAANCDVERVTWLGGTLLNVEIRLGPAELSVPFEVNVGATPAGGTREEI